MSVGDEGVGSTEDPFTVVESAWPSSLPLSPTNFSSPRLWEALSSGETKYDERTLIVIRLGVVFTIAGADDKGEGVVDRLESSGLATSFVDTLWYPLSPLCKRGRLRCVEVSASARSLRGGGELGPRVFDGGVLGWPTAVGESIFVS